MEKKGVGLKNILKRVMVRDVNYPRISRCRGGSCASSKSACRRVFVAEWYLNDFFYIHFQLILVVWNCDSSFRERAVSLWMFEFGVRSSVVHRRRAPSKCRVPVTNQEESWVDMVVKAGGTA